MEERITIFIDGGLVQCVVADKLIKVLIVDRDFEGADPSETMVVNDQRGLCHVEPAVNDKAFNDSLWNEFEGQMDE